MAEFDPEACERNRQSGGYKGEVLRAVLVAHTERLKGSSRVTNAWWRTIFYPPRLFFASSNTICLTVVGRRPPHSQLSRNKTNEKIN